MLVAHLVSDWLQRIALFRQMTAMATRAGQVVEALQRRGLELVGEGDYVRTESSDALYHISKVSRMR